MKTIYLQHIPKRNASTNLFRIIGLFMLTLLLNISTQAQKPSDSLIFSTDGKVNATVISGNYLYLGGDFSNIGKKIGPVAFFHDTSSYPQQGMPIFGDMRAYYMSDKVLSVVPDGSGGWFVGGSFYRINNRKDSIKNLVHILPDHSIDRHFVINWGSIYKVYVLKTDGDYLYAGGDFSLFDAEGNVHFHVIRINKKTGTIDPNWNPDLTSAGQVEKIEIGNDKVFLAGWIGNVEGFQQDAMVVVDKISGKRISFPSTSSVTAIKLMGDTLLIGQPDMYWSAYADGFGYIFPGTALLDTSLEIPTEPAPQAGSANNLIADGNGGWYAAGYFDKWGIFHLDNKMKVLENFSQDDVKGVNNQTRMLLTGNSLFVATHDTKVTAGSHLISYLFKLDATTGAIDETFNLKPNGQVLSLAVKGDTLFVGGEFDTIAGKARNGLAAFSLKDNSLLPWSPVINFDNYKAGFTGEERYLDDLLVKNGMLYVSGKFQIPAANFTEDGTGIYGLARFDLQSGKVDTSFYLHTVYSDNPRITSMATEGNKMYVTGQFNLVKNDLQVKNAGIVDLSSKTLLPVNTDLDFTQINGFAVPQVAVQNGIVYFWGIGATEKSTGKLRSNLVSLYSSNQQLTKWNPNPNNTVNALAFSNKKLMISGNFYFLKSYTLNFAAINCGTKEFIPLPFNLQDVFSMVVTDQYVFIGGNFSSFNNEKVNSLCRLKRKGLQFTAFPHGIKKDNGRAVINTLSIGDSGLYVVGKSYGRFNNVGGVERQNICLLNPETGKLKAWNPPRFDGTAARVFSYGNTVVMAGDFGLMPSWEHKSIAKIDLNTYQITDWNPEISGYFPDIFSLLVSGDTVYIGGRGIQKVNSKVAGELSALSATSGSLFEGFTPVTLSGGYGDDNVTVISKYGNALYIAGNFKTLSGISTRNCLAKINASTGAVEDWDAHLDAGWNPVETILPLDTAVYIGGADINIKDKDFRANLLKTDAVNGTMMKMFTANYNNVIRKIVRNKRGDIAVAGKFNQGLFLLDKAKDSLIAVKSQPEFKYGPENLAALGNVFLAVGNRMKEFDAFTNKPGFFAYDPVHDTVFVAFSTPVFSGDIATFAASEAMLAFGGEFLGLNEQTLSENIAFMSMPELNLKPGVTSWKPKEANTVDPFALSVYGSGFGNNTTVQLAKGEKTFTPDSLQISYNKVIAYFNGENFSVGKWDITIKVNDSTSKTYAEAFNIRKGETTETWADWIGPDMTLVGKPTTYYLLYGNRGNRDAYGVFLYLAVKDDQTVILPHSVKQPPVKGVDWDTIPNYVESDYFIMEPYQGKVYTVFLPYIPAGYEGAFKIILTTEVSSHPMRVAISKPIYNNYNELLGNSTKSSQGIMYDFFSCTYAVAGTFADLTPGLGCAKAAFDNSVMLAIAKYHSHESIQAEDVANSIGMTILGCIPGEAALSKGFAIAKGMASMYGAAGDASGAVGACGSFAYDLSRLFLDVTGYMSHDPNAKYGPAGKGSSVYVPSKAPYNYIVTFENDSAASAPAQRVIITDTLDKNVFDISSFKPTGFGFGDTTYLYKKNDKDTVDIDLRPTKEVIVRVFYHLDQTTGILTWTFLTLNPNTYELIDNIDDGFLPPNRKAPEGEGNVFYSVKPLDNLAEGTMIKNSAHIVFDWNAAIPTDTWENITDNIIPESAVNTLPEYEVDKDFTVSWKGSDEGSGIFSYTVFVSENDSAYYPWITDTHETSAVFSGEAGVVYKFYTIASDSAGNKEAAPGIYDAMTRVSGTGIDKFGTGDKMQFHLFPNPAKEHLSVKYYLPESSSVRIDILNLCGHRVMESIQSSAVHGTNKALLDISKLPAGYYFVRIFTKYGIQTRKVIIQ